MCDFESKKILLAITGGIAAYKSAELTRLLVKSGAEIKVLMTASATEFITPLTMQALSGNPVHTELLDRESEAAMDHISLARWADCILIAPASANTIAQIAHGFANNLLTTVVLASTATIAIAPAMNQQMWLNAATQSNITSLAERGAQILGPGEGAQACGEFGPGRMLEPEQIKAQLYEVLKKAQPSEQNTGKGLSNQRIVITAGPTREQIDPVRYISNNSSGKMGYAIAAAAVKMGATVTLISGPVNLPAPQGAAVINILSAEQMLEAATTASEQADIFIATAAVADYRASQISEHKIKKQDETLMLALAKTPDILATVAKLKSTNNPKLYCVGFAAETKDVHAYAKKKLINKKIDLIAANDVGRSDIGFNSDTNELELIWPNKQTTLKKAEKSVIATQLLLAIKSELEHDR